MATTKHGDQITFLEYEQDPDDRKGWEGGWVCHRIEAYVGDECVGYLKIVYVSSKRLPECVPDMWVWLCKAKGYHFSPPTREGYDEYASKRYMTLSTNKFWMAEKQAAYEKWLAKADVPLVGYIKTEDGWLRQGIALALYEHGARWLLETHGLKLRGDRDQTAEACAVWRYMVASDRYPTVALDYKNNRDQTVYELDYTDQP